jgi:hypothetical protein
MLTEFVYTWPDGRQEVRYRRQNGTHECAGMREQVDCMRARDGDQSPYSYREVPGWEETTSVSAEPTCGKCGAVISTGFMALFCPEREQCEFWPDDKESQEFLRILRNEPPSNTSTEGTT